MGACIQCDNKSCFTPFHVTCARRAKLYMKIKVDGKDEVSMRAYCDRHSPVTKMNPIFCVCESKQY